MAEGDAVIYNCFKFGLLNGTYNLASTSGSSGHTLKMILVSGYTPNIDTHQKYADVSAAEFATGSGYTAGGAELANQVTTMDTTNDRGKFDADDVAWATLSIATPSHAILYDDSTTVPAADMLIMYFVLGTTAPNGTTYTLIFGANGLILLT